jgi:dihydroorotase
MAVGEDANVVVFDPTARWRVDRDHLASRSRNTPYDGRELTGRVRALVVRGTVQVNESTLS